MNDTGTPFFNIPTFWIIFVFILFSTYKDFEYTLSFLEQGYTLGQVKHAMSTGDTSIVDYERGSGAIYRITKVVYPGFRLLVSAVGIHYYVKGGKWSSLYLVAIISLTILESFTTGGRLQVFQLIITLFVCYNLIYSRKSNTKFRFSKATIFISIGVLVFAIIAVSMARGWEEEDFSEKYYRYLCGNIALLDYYLPKITDSTPYYLVWNSFNGLWGIIFPVLYFIFRIPKPDIYQNALNTINVTQDDVQIAPDTFMNAYTTPYYFLYADARIPGVILGMLLLGFLCGKIYANVKQNMTGRNIAYYVIVSHMIFQTLVSYPFTYSSYTFVVLFFLFYKRKTMNIFSFNIFKRRIPKLSRK